MNLLLALAFVLLLLLAPVAYAELKVANVFGDHMVLQQEMPISVWGWAAPGASVQVDLTDYQNAAAFKTRTGDDGKWSVKLPSRKANGKTLQMLVVSGEEKIKFDDILVGEVWICSGQSNME